MKMRSAIRKVFESKVFYIIFSVLASITIWLYVSYIENPDVSKDIKGVKVVYVNEDYVTDRNLVITDRSTDTVTLRFSGKRGTVTQLNNTNVTVTVDLSGITDKGIWQLTYKYNLPLEVSDSAVTMTSGTPNIIALTVDDQAHKDVPVRGTYGSVAEGYLADTMEIDPDTITVSGPDEVVSQIDYAWVNVQRDNISKTVEEMMTFTLMDAAGHEVVSDMLTFSQDTVRVHIQVDMWKELPLEVTPLWAAGADETNTTINISPVSIMVSGDAEVLENMNKIPLGTIDLSSFLMTDSKSFPIILEDGITNLTGVTSANVTVNITGLDWKQVTTTNIQQANLPPGHTAEILTNSLDIKIRGPAGELERVSDADISVVADLSSLETTGTFSVLAKVYVDGNYESVGAIGEYKVTVSVSKAQT
jgi:YbbR domain-containing protein